MTISTKISLFCQALVISEKKIFDVWSNLHNYHILVDSESSEDDDDENSSESEAETELKLLDNITSKGGLTYQRQEKKKKLEDSESTNI
jgi:hypothetical protein